MGVTHHALLRGIKYSIVPALPRFDHYCKRARRQEGDDYHNYSLIILIRRINEKHDEMIKINNLTKITHFGVHGAEAV
jgi:hypothetical protein